MEMEKQNHRKNIKAAHILAKHGLTLQGFADRHNFPQSTVSRALKLARETEMPVGVKTMMILRTLSAYENKEPNPVVL